MSLEILEREAATDVLASPDFDVVPYAERYQALAARLRLDFSSIIFTLHHLPLARRGAEHAARRAGVARLMAEQRAAVTAALPGIVRDSFGCLAVRGDHDLMAQAVVPCVDAVLGAYAGIRTGLPPSSLVSRIFSQKIGVAQRRRMEGELAQLIARLRAAFPGESDDRIGARLALVVLGRDALTGAMARSLEAFFAGMGGARLNTGRLPVPPTHTGVPYIDREAVLPSRSGGRESVPGEVIRCDLQSLEGAGDSERLRFFGAGAHVCLGRALSMEVFGIVADYLGGLETRVEVLDCVMRDCDVFAIPDRLTVRVSG